MKTLTAVRLRTVLDYDLDTGLFKWRISTSNRALAGSVAGRSNGNGYRRIMIDHGTYYAHRLAWFYVYGEWPVDELDHADGNRSNNRILNLRPATHAENGQNQPLRCSNSSGKHCVSWHKHAFKWCAYIWVSGKKKHLGLFESIDDASAAYLKAKAMHHQFQPIPRDLIGA